MPATWSKNYRMGNATAKQTVSIHLEGKNSENCQIVAQDLNVYMSNSNSGAPPNLKQEVKSTGNLLKAKGAVVTFERANKTSLGGNVVIANANQTFQNKIVAECSENSKLTEKKINIMKMNGNAVLQGQLMMKSASETEAKMSTKLEKHASDGNTLEMLGNGGLENEPVLAADHILKMDGAKNLTKKIERQNVIRQMDPATGIMREEVVENGQNLGQDGQNLFEDD